jgi:hypothetical protein
VSKHFTITLDPVAHERLREQAKARGTSLRQHLHRIIREGAAVPKPYEVPQDQAPAIVPGPVAPNAHEEAARGRVIEAAYGAPVPISDDVEAEKSTGTAGRRIEATALAAAEAIARLSTKGTSIADHRPATRAGHPTLKRDGAE